jgi:hypothetical protein
MPGRKRGRLDRPAVWETRFASKDRAATLGSESLQFAARLTGANEDNWGGGYRPLWPHFRIETRSFP